MSNLLVQTPERQYNRAEIELIKQTVANGANDLQLKWFLYQCANAGLDPLLKQIYCIMRGGKLTVQVGIDGLRAIADRTGAYAGSDQPRFAYDEDGKLVSATVTVYKFVQGERVSWARTAFWAEYCPAAGQDSMWRKMPHAMLGKCAEALALRAAFPAQMSGIYTREEMAPSPAADAVEYEAVSADPLTGEIVDEPKPANGRRINDTDTPCPSCNAPSGKFHTPKCGA